MEKQALVVMAIIASAFLLNACSEGPETPDSRIPDFEDVRFSGNFYCSPEINWSEVALSEPGDSAQMDVHRSYVSEWVEDSLKDERNSKVCITNKADMTCLLLYAVLNNKPELCRHFPEQRTVSFSSPPSMGSGEGGSNINQTCHYRDMCRAFVKVYNE